MAKSSDRNANVNFKVNGADSAKQDINGIRASVEGLGDQGAKAVQPLVDAFTNIERADANVTKKISEGRVITERDGKIMLQQFELLKDTINASFGSVANAPVAVQQAYAKAEQQFERTAAKIRTTTDAVSDQKEVLREGGVQWTGLGDQINKVAGRYGGLQIAAIAVFAALQQGWQIGTNIAKAMGADVDATGKALDNFTVSAVACVQAIRTDGLAGALQQAIFHFRNLDNTINGSGDAIKNLNTVVNVGVDRLDALKLSNDELTKIVQAYTLAQEGGVDGLRLFNELLATTDPKELAEKLRLLGGRFADLAKANDIAKKATDDLQKAHEALKSSIEGVIEKIRAEIEARRNGTQTVQDEIDKYGILKRVLEENRRLAAQQEADLGGVTLSMRALIQEIDNLLPKHDQYSERIKNANEGLKQLLTNNETLTPEEKKRVATIQEQIEKYNQLTPVERLYLEQKIQEVIQLTAAKAAAEAHKQGLDDLVKSTDGAATSQNELTVKWRDGKAEITSAGVAIERTATHIAGLSDAAKKSAPDVETYVSVLDEIDKHAIRAADSVKKLNQAIFDSGKAAREAAGAQLSTPPSGGGSAPPPATGGPEWEPGNDSGM